MENGQLRSGVLIRHLVLPGELENTKVVIDWVAETFRPGEVLFSLMSQYTPQPGAEGKLARRVTKAEYRAADEGKKADHCPCANRDSVRCNMCGSIFDKTIFSTKTKEYNSGILDM